MSTARFILYLLMYLPAKPSGGSEDCYILCVSSGSPSNKNEIMMVIHYTSTATQSEQNRETISQ